MPAYDYRCSQCGLEFEVTRPVGQTSEESCPECGGPTKRVFSPVGVVFKGSGFHSTDYRPKRSGDDSQPSGGSSKESCPASGSSSSCAGCPASSDTK